MAAKRPWQEPQLTSLEQLTPAYGECAVGTTPVAGGVVECSGGNGAGAGAACTTGNGAKNTCLSGNGQK
jgi:hypothetical protein